MPKNKDLKRLVRSRMRKTGESYTAARSRLIRSEACSESGADFAELAGMSDAAVEARTGRTWKQWVKTLDAVDAASLPHRDIARHLHERHELPGWWAQTVTVGYERIRGLREKGQRRGGGYELNKSRTFPVPVARLYAAFGARQRGRWLGDVSLTVRKATREKSMRISWEDGTPLDAYFQAKGPSKSQVQLQHRELATKSLAQERREYWTERLAALARILGGRS